MSVIAYMLTTIDNPYNPFTDWDAWQQFDESSGYNSSGLLARIVRTSDELSEADQQQAINDAVTEIVNVNALGVSRVVSMEIEL